MAAKKPIKPKHRAGPRSKTERELTPIPKYHLTHRSWDKMAVMTVICDYMRTSSLGLHFMCKTTPDLPTAAAVLKWFDEERMAGGETPLIDMYARAKESQADYMADEMIEIADNGKNDYMDQARRANGEVDRVPDHEHMSRSRLRVDTRKFIAAKLKPRKYGDKLELSGDPERPLSAMTEADLQAQILALMRKIEST
jgi:hypothetical protein